MMEIEKSASQAAGVVFTTAQLVWLDQETGEVLEIDVCVPEGEVVGSGAWVEQLAEQGFALRHVGEPGLRRYHCRIEIK